MSDAMAPVLSAVAAYHQKKLDRDLILKSMGRTPELHPERCRVTDRLAIELTDDLKAIGKMITEMQVWTIGGEL